MTDDHVTTTAAGDDRLKRYVLGLLDEAGRDDVETRAFDDPAVAAALDEVETDLVDDYVAGRLDSADRRAIAHALATRPRLRARVDVARALSARRRGHRQGITWWLPALAAAAVLLIGGIWLLRAGRAPVTPEPSSVTLDTRTTEPLTPGVKDRQEPTPDEPAETAPSTAPADSVPARPARVVFAVTLPMGTTRAATPTPVDVTADATHVLLRVPVAEGDDFPSYRIRIAASSGATAHERTERTLAPDRTLAATVPREALPDGTYDVVLDGLDAAGNAEPLAFLQVQVSARR